MRVINNLSFFIGISISVLAGNEPMRKIGEVTENKFSIHARKNSQFSSPDPVGGDGIDINFNFKGEVVCSAQSSGYLLKMLFDAVMAKYREVLTAKNVNFLTVKGIDPHYFSVEVSKENVVFSRYSKSYNSTYKVTTSLEAAAKFIDAVGSNRKPDFKITNEEMQSFSKRVEWKLIGSVPTNKH